MTANIGVGVDGVIEDARKYMESKAEYKADGNYLTKVTGSDGSSTTYSYDVTRGKLTGVSELRGVSIGYIYNLSND